MCTNAKKQQRLLRTALRWGWGILLLSATLSQAHQLTGTDVATLAQLAVDHRQVGGTYEVQFSELAGFDERKRMDQDRDGTLSLIEQDQYAEAMARQLRLHLALELDGQALPFELLGGQVLPADTLVAPAQMTLRFELRSEPADFTRPRRLEFRDDNQFPRLMHSDVSIEALPLVDLAAEGLDSGAGALKQVRVQAKNKVQVRVQLVPAAAAWQGGPAATAAGAGQTPTASASGVERLKTMLRSESLSLQLVVLALGLALFLGAAHALEPGHGKTLVAAYLVGSHGTVGNAVFLGSVVTFTHTFSVILIGLITLFASQYLLPEQIFPWLGALSSLLIVGMGCWLLARALSGQHGHTHDHGHTHSHGHTPLPSTPGPIFTPLAARPHDYTAARPARPSAAVHDHGQGPHTHVPEGEVTLGSLLTLGISGGIVPCPGALIILLLAVALHRIAFGLLLILAFSLGLAAVLIAIGLLMVKARPLMARFSGSGPLIRALPVVSAIAITLLGLAMGVRTLVEAGILIIRL